MVRYPRLLVAYGTTSLFSIAEKADVHHNDEGLVSSSAPTSTSKDSGTPSPLFPSALRHPPKTNKHFNDPVV